MSKKTEPNKMFNKIEEAADGKLKCECGNKDWKLFIYVGGENMAGVTAGCKRCGAVYRYKSDGTWIFKTRPPMNVQKEGDGK